MSALGLTEPQRYYLIRASELEAQGMSFMPSDVGQRSRVSALVRRGLMAQDDHESKHEGTGQMGRGFRLTDAGREAVSP